VWCEEKRKGCPKSRGTLSRHRPLTIAVGKRAATPRTASRICTGYRGEEDVKLLTVRRSQSILCFWPPPGKEKRKGRLSYLVRHDGAVRVLHDRGQRAVVVQEHRDLLPLGCRRQRVEPAQCPRVPLLQARTAKKLADRFCHPQRCWPTCVNTTRGRTIQSSRSASTPTSRGATSLCLGEDALMESSHDPVTAVPRSTCAAAIFRHDSPPLAVLGGGNEKCRAAATTASNSGTSFVMAIPQPTKREEEEEVLLI
jgi:hypothetical protein